MPCQACLHYLPASREPGHGLCRLKSDSTGTPLETHPNDLCEFFDLDVNKLEEAQMVICRHCGGVAMVLGDIELCDQCLEKFNLQQFLRDEGADTRALVRFNCNRTYRERWLKRRLEVKQGGKGV